ncbi:2'-5' RNA ligase family protein [Mucilaginibacter gossypii]|uniref:2'-5' RNA ligase n=1 Tax=Mucilaginibacter gossypii TaxID=551996 RepID=A0A1G8A1V1_9SPHI|nr:2'-5' RNA ligase family protein [Mucilaginibacter gossypii]SDH14888.1 2'-5' RNA ligase [Mucilaginibacter gossypii]
MQAEQKPLILTLRLDAESQTYFDSLRRRHFPPELNFLRAHLTLFHQLPNKQDTLNYLDTIKVHYFEMNVAGLRHLGAGVAYLIDSMELQQFHAKLKRHFQQVLIPQDMQAFKPHITIQNKVTPEASKWLLAELRSEFVPFPVKAVGLDLWEYLGGPWRHYFGYNFVE